MEHRLVALIHGIPYVDIRRPGHHRIVVRLRVVGAWPVPRTVIRKDWVIAHLLTSCEMRLNSQESLVVIDRVLILMTLSFCQALS